MEEYEEFSRALNNLKEAYRYEEPYEKVVLAGLLALYKVCLDRSWILIKRVLKDKGYPHRDTEYPRQVLKAASKAGVIRDEKAWLEALTAGRRSEPIIEVEKAPELVREMREKFYPLFCDLGTETRKNWLK